MYALSIYQNQLKMLLVAAAIVVSGCGGNGNSADGGELENPRPSTSAVYELVWSDDFDGNTLDLSKWDVQIGDGTLYGVPGWGNNEKQFYTADNITLESGNLVITARVEEKQGYQFTSGRIRTQGKLDFTFGRVEASIKVPEGVGLWAAFWMLGSDPSPYGDWAGRGEIDILESFGQSTQFAQAALHFGMKFPLNQSVFKKQNDIDPADGYHQYAIEWDVEQIRWFIDGVNYYTVKAESYWNYYYSKQNGFVEGSAAAPFDADQHILFNLAVGGNPAGPPDPDDGDVFPGQMMVEYVRVYQCPIDPENTGLGCANSIDPVDPFLIAVGGDGTAPAQDVAIASYDLYIDGPGVLFEATQGERALAIAVDDNGGAFTLTQTPASDPGRGTVIDVATSGGGNFRIVDEAGETFELFGMGDPEDPGIYGGELKFDLFIVGAATDATGSLQVKMDSGFPDEGFVELPLSDITHDQWTSVSLRMSEVIQSNIGVNGGGPLDMKKIVSLIVLEATKSARLQFDNIRLVCGAPESRPCGIVTVASVPQNVYIDEVDPVWDNGIAAADSGSGYVSYFDGTNPTGSDKIQWQEVADTDSSRGQVIDVTFNDSSEAGVFFIQSKAGVNLTAYSEGEVAFDLIVTDYGDNTSGMTMKIDCTFPCTSGDQSLGMVAEGVWETIRVPVKELIFDGLDVAGVNTGLVLFPTTQGGNINFRIDNIRWNPTTDIDVGPRPPIGYSSDFESLDPAAPFIGEGWISFANVFPVSPGAYYNYGPFPTPNGTGGFANIATGEGGGDPQFGSQHLELFSDYNNTQAQDNGDLVEALSFQEYTLLDTDGGTYVLTFDVKAPVVGGITPPSKAIAFIKTIDPKADFATTSNVEVDLSSVDSSGWVSYSIELAVNALSLEGQTLQFGFSNQATNNDDSALLYDNVVFALDGSVPPPTGFSYKQNFEGLDAGDPDALGTFGGEGFQVFDASFRDGVFLYSYGPFSAPNGGQGFSAIAAGQGGVAQGAQYLNIYSDYGNVDHADSAINHITSVFKEYTITADDIGDTYTLSFDAKRPETGGLDASKVTALAFIKTLDPANNFATTNNMNVDMTNISKTGWARFTMSLDLADPLLDGQILQFGFETDGCCYADSGVYYDNIDFGVVTD